MTTSSHSSPMRSFDRASARPNSSATLRRAAWSESKASQSRVLSPPVIGKRALIESPAPTIATAPRARCWLARCICCSDKIRLFQLMDFRSRFFPTKMAYRTDKYRRLGGDPNTDQPSAGWLASEEHGSEAPNRTPSAGPTSEVGQRYCAASTIGRGGGNKESLSACWPSRCHSTWGKVPSPSPMLFKSSQSQCTARLDAGRTLDMSSAPADVHPSPPDGSRFRSASQVRMVSRVPQ